MATAQHPHGLFRHNLFISIMQYEPKEHISLLQLAFTHSQKIYHKKLARIWSTWCISKSNISELGWIIPVTGLFLSCGAGICRYIHGTQTLSLPGQSFCQASFLRNLHTSPRALAGFPDKWHWWGLREIKPYKFVLYWDMGKVTRCLHEGTNTT